MKKIELVLIGFVVLALIIRFFHLPYSEELTTYSLKFISVVYLYFGFALFNNIELKNIIKKDSYQTISKNKIFGGIGTGIALAITVNGISFKFQSLPGTAFILGIGLLGIILIASFSLSKLKKSTDNYYSNILKRIVFFGLISIFLFAIPTENWLKWKYPNHPEYVNAVLEARENSDNQELWDKVDLEWEKVNNELNK